MCFCILLIFFLEHFSSLKNTEKLKSRHIKTEHSFQFKLFIYTKTEFIIILLHLELVKSGLRSSLVKENLSNMAILSIESKIRQTAFENITLL